MDGDAEDSTNPFLLHSTNPFEDDVDDDVFLKPSTSRFSSELQSKNPFFNKRDTARGDVSTEEIKEQLQSRTLASTERSLAVLLETELVGENITEELSEQRQKLENCHKKVDDINANLRKSQKHLKRLRSIFGGIKDYLMGVRIRAVQPVDKCKTHTAEDLTTNSSSVAPKPLSTDVEASPHPRLAKRVSCGDISRPVGVEYAIDRNIDQMFNHVVNLKGLAVDLRNELDTQNELIDTLNDKTEEADASLARQNRDIAKLLK